jgi:hypothetical protein
MQPATKDMKKSHSTDDFANEKFKPHGRLEVHLDGDIAVFHAEGPFNLEAIVALGDARRAAVADWGASGRRATIVEFQTSMLMSQDALDAYAKGMQSHLAQVKPSVAVAWVVAPGLEGRLFMLPYFAEIFARIGVPWKAFEQMEEAKAWVQTHLDARPPE